MLSHRTTARVILLLLFSWVLAGTAAAAPPPDRIVFPVVGDVAYTDDFGDPRGNGGHQGNDLMAPRRTPAVAAEAGTVKTWTTSWRAGCMLYLYGASGATYLYIHLNNDVTRRNDNRGGCVPGVAYAPGLRDGQRVRAGQLVGFVGDSGDADGIAPHLHFELHPDGSRAVSPFPWLRTARRLLFPALAPPDPAAAARPLTLALHGTVRSSAEGALALRVERVRTSTGLNFRLTRNVTVAVPPGAIVERATGNGRRPAALRRASSGQGVVVWTEAVRPTRAELLGRPGALSAARVLFQPE